MWVETGGFRAEVGELDVVLVTVASVTLGASERCCSRSWRPQASLAIPTAQVCRGTARYGNAVRPGCAWSWPLTPSR